MALMSISQAARELGCSQEHVRRMIRSGRWPAYRLGLKATRIYVEEVRALGKLVHESERERRAVSNDG